MNIERLKTNTGKEIHGPILIAPLIFSDKRGYFYESWNQNVFNDIVGEKINFIQDNISLSKKAVLRGLHFQREPKSQGKLIRCCLGEIFDVAVDLRLSSSTFGEWISARLSKQNKKQLWIPNGFAHGFLTMSNSAEVTYKVNNLWCKEYESSIIWNDEMINIEWPIEELGTNQIILSIKDSKAQFLKDALQKGEVFQ